MSSIDPGEKSLFAKWTSILAVGAAVGCGLCGVAYLEPGNQITLFFAVPGAIVLAVSVIGLAFIGITFLGTMIVSLFRKK